MTIELFDQMQVHRVLRQKINEAGGAVPFARQHKLRPRDIDLTHQGVFTESVLRSIGFRPTTRYVKIEASTP